MKPEVAQLRQKLAYALDAIRSLFKPGCKITLFIRWPDEDDQSRNLLMTDDDHGTLPDSIKRFLDTHPHHTPKRSVQ